MKLTIFTPTYNRAYILNKAYESLKLQTCKNFEWLVIDDGSTDDTESLIQKFQDEHEIHITYKKKENGGQHTALNMAIDLIDSGLLMILDSDDYLMPNAVERILYWESTIKNREKMAGVSGLRTYSTGEIIGDKWNLSENYVDATNLERKKYGLRGDKAEAYYITVLKKYYPIPVYKGENDVEKGVLWNRVASDGYKIRWFNEGIYVCEYLNDGMTRNIENNYLKNFQGYTLWIMELANIQQNKTDKIKCIALYCYIANKKKVDRKVLAQKFGVSTLDIRFAYLLGKIIHVKMKYRR